MKHHQKPTYIYHLFRFYNVLHMLKNVWEMENIEEYNSSTVLDQLSSGMAAAVCVREVVDDQEIK